ncbi:hypothetical protein [Nocardioides solisilvae]|uniref:hypothetical protein n=1 Tax=Nocardioides solisilvae TaxID=1542435 RepID=UPI000D743392|nr:hypothetical protein [Nocardioides solisilvae]
MTHDLQQDHERWLDELTLELRLLDVDGRMIGDAVATAREFLVDAGVPARETFGSPRAYAARLGLEPTPEKHAALRRTVTFAAVDVLGFLAFAFTGGAAWRGERFEVDAGALVLVGVVLALVAATPRLLPTVLRAAPWKIGAGFATLLALQVGVLLLLGDVALFSIPAWPVAAVGLLVVSGSVVRAWLERDELADPVVEPLVSGDGGPSRPAGVRGREHLLVVLPQVVSFVAAWAFVLLDVLTGG